MQTSGGNSHGFILIDFLSLNSQNYTALAWMKFFLKFCRCKFCHLLLIGTLSVTAFMASGNCQKMKRNIFMILTPLRNEILSMGDHSACELVTTVNLALRELIVDCWSPAPHQTRNHSDSSSSQQRLY